MPLTSTVTFKVQLQKQNRFQVPKKIRWFYKLDADQMLSVTIALFELGFEESFLANMLPDGRITVPRIVIVSLQQRLPNLKASFINVTLKPA